ncbi:hypothetical protein EEK90_10605 [Muribaculaceae bacterium Isolate-036 (Harlan)]|nr:hypothetical protein EEK90_10605 [Muribaculaceae bacterium Isolate-036 (Harlan)]
MLPLRLVKTPHKILSMNLTIKFKQFLTYDMHGRCHIGIIEKIFDIREKRCNFVYRHGFELVFWWYLKLLIFLQLGKNPCRFFMTLPLEISTCET